jgi:molybdate transport system substrate-binding protein
VGSADALRAAVLQAGRIAYSTGPSGVALMALFERWGITQALQGRLVQARPGVPVGSLIAEGAADLGFQQLSELLHVEGLALLGPMPPGLEIVTTFSGAVGAHSRQPALARQVLDFFASPASADAKRRHGMAVPAA